MPKLSILMPTYNYGNYIGQALSSISSQNFNDYEVIVSDDASTDNTEQIVKEFQVKDNRLKYIKHMKNMGMVNNWNYCLSKASGCYIQFLFAYDYILDCNALERMVRLLDSIPNIAMAACARWIVNDKSEKELIAEGLGPTGLVKGEMAIRKCLLTQKNLIGEPSVVMFRKEVATRGFDNSLRQLVDLEMWFHMCEKFDLYYIDEALFAFRRHNSQQSFFNNLNPVALEEFYHLIPAYINFIKYTGAGVYRASIHYLLIYSNIKKLKKIKSDSKIITAAIQAYRSIIPARYFILISVFYRLFRIFQNLSNSFLKRFRRFVKNYF